MTQALSELVRRRAFPFRMTKDVVADTLKLTRGMNTNGIAQVVLQNDANSSIVIGNGSEQYPNGVSARFIRFKLKLVDDSVDPPVYFPINRGERFIITIVHRDFNYNDQIIVTANNIRSDYDASPYTIKLEDVTHATADVLPGSPVYVSPTLTATVNGTLVIDGHTFTSNGGRVLIKNQADNTQNGIYVVTDRGSAGTPYILTRATDFNAAATPIPAGVFTFVTTSSSDTNYYTKWHLDATVTIIDTNPVVWDAASYIATNLLEPPAYASGSIPANISTTIFNQNTASTTSSGIVSSGSLEDGVKFALPRGRFNIVIQNMDMDNPITDVTALPAFVGGTPDLNAVRTFDILIVRRNI